MSSLYRDWRGTARSVVEHLRLVAGRYPADPLLATLIGELTAQSREFAALWVDHRACNTATYDLPHPIVGALTVTLQSFTTTDSPDQFLAVMTADSGSASEAALPLLAQLTAAPAPPTALKG